MKDSRVLTVIWGRAAHDGDGRGARGSPPRDPPRGYQRRVFLGEAYTFRGFALAEILVLVF